MRPLASLERCVESLVEEEKGGQQLMPPSLLRSFEAK